ncbi:hypothetical protein L6258_03015 [Candidatus Parcubacteria bacterium]|nr:hypothetical protein [Candidatus Parcubacteria bacterium]
MGRTLIYIPIIHTDPDLGSLASDVEEKAMRLLGERWKEHKRIVEQYWKEIAEYFSARGGSAFGREGKKLKGVKIFQDGLPVGGEAAQIMIDELAQAGSPNYRLLKNLSDQGAMLLKTEDVALLKQEYQITKDLVAKKNLLSTIASFLSYKLRKDRLLKARDKYIAKQINSQLGDGEMGILFLGAYHEVLPKLTKDIEIVPFKDPDKVKEYYQSLSKKL